MKIIFAGTPEFAIPSLDKLYHSKHEICAVYTQPDRPKGRGQKLASTPVKIFALQHNLPIVQPENFRDETTKNQLKAFAADVFIDVACGLFLPKSVLTIPKFGCINIHPSLLPRFRGAAPIQRAILAGDTVTGITIMQMDEGLDTGNIIKQIECPIETTDTTLTLSNKLAQLGAKLLLEVINELESGPLNTTPQNNALSNYAEKINKEEAKIDWNMSISQIDRMIRAFNPWPIAFIEIKGLTLRIFEAKIINTIPSAKPGTIMQKTKNTIEIATKDGILQLLKIQLPGGKVLDVKDVLNARKELFVVGDCLI